MSLYTHKLLCSVFVWL